uniref:Transmembrane protein n=1 Tax=Tanacetum cinerariifolium TaxID=118510 RepID=A0A699S7C2_TANCI|nr:hypothetical protein [Tanacetum cinerariifolium]
MVANDCGGISGVGCGDDDGMTRMVVRYVGEGGDDVYDVVEMKMMVKMGWLMVEVMMVGMVMRMAWE